MRSIRLSLVVYFLLLLTASLSVASVLVYRSARRTLKDKEEATRKFVQSRYDQRMRQERNRLDEQLLTQAKSLARSVQIQVQPRRLWFREFHALGLLTALPGPNAYATAPLWYIQGTRGSFSYHLFRRSMADLHLPRSDVVLPAEGGGKEFFQIDSNYRGRPLRSASLGALSFPDPVDFAPKDALRWDFEDFPLTEGKVVRRVRLKASSARQISIIPPWPARPARPNGKPPAKGGPGAKKPPAKEVATKKAPPKQGSLKPPNGGKPGPGSGPGKGRGNARGWRYEYPPAVIYIQYAADTAERDEVLARLRSERDEEFAKLNSETDRSLSRQLNQLLLIGGVTFAATVLGTFWLIWLGLLPLRRLSHAVSEVSARDFRLPIDAARLPRELRPIAERLGVTLDLLKKAFAREKQATADISHELRTPLAAILTTTELALRKPRPPEKYRELLQDCHHSAQAMHHVVERLLTLARLDAGVDSLKPATIDVGLVAEQCAAVVRPLAEARGLQLTVDNRCGGPDQGTGQLITDPDKLREVLNNLLHNAVQYNRPEGRINLEVVRNNGCVEVEVRDTGIGIAPESRERIFERFYRADPSRHGDGLNAGLGLAIVKECVDLMGGTITVDSALGHGSAFRVRLPAHREAGAA